MKTFIAAGLLAFAGPAFAQSAPAHPAGHAAGQHQDHSQHQGQKHGESHEGHKAEAGKHCCCKDMKAGAKMECCDKQRQHQSSSDAHKGHQPNP